MRDEILWNMTVTEKNLMLHAFYFTEGREVRKPEERSRLLSKFQRVLTLFK